MSFLTFPVIGDYSALAPGSTIQGKVTFRPNLLPGVAAHGHTDGTDFGIIPGVTHAKIVNGILVPASAFATQVILYSNDPQFNLSGQLQYTVHFDVKVDNVPVTLNDFVFDAPDDSTTIDLNVVSPADPALTIYSIGKPPDILVLTDDGDGMFAISGSGIVEDGTTGLFEVSPEISKELVGYDSSAAPGLRLPTAVKAELGSAPPTYVTQWANRYDRLTNAYNWKASNTRKLTASIGKAAAGKGIANHLMIGDSMTAGVMGGAESPTANTLTAWPERYRALLANRGVPTSGTGVAPCIKGDFQYDTRWTLTGWNTGLAYTAYTTSAGSTATFVSDQAGTSVSVYYAGNSSSMTVTIDGGAPVALTMDGVQHTVVQNFTGLANTVHTVVITSVGTSYNQVIGASVQGGTSGLRVHNIAVGGSTAHYSTSGFLATWDVTTAGYMNPILTGCLTASSITPDVVYVCLGGNDLANDSGYVLANTIGALSALRTQYATSDFVLIGETMTNAITTTKHETFLNGLYSLADTLDVPVIDMYDRFGNYTQMVANLLMGDGAHPNASAQFAFGQNIANLVMS